MTAHTDPAPSQLVVLELGTDPAVAFAGRLMARTGARVILVEESDRPRDLRDRAPMVLDDQHARGATAHYLDQGKWSISLAGTPEAHQLLAQLVANCDAVLVDRAAWLQHSAVLQRQDIPVTVVSPFGLDGPDADRPATAGTLFAMGGEASMLPGGLGFEMFPDAPPLLIRGQVAEFDAGVIGALVSAAALYRAEAGRRGPYADVSKLEVQTSLNRWLVSHYRLSGWLESRETRAYSYGGLVECSDGYVMLQPTTDGHWHGMVAMLGSPAWLLDPSFDVQEGREKAASEVQDSLLRWAGVRTRAEVFAEGLEHGVPVAPFRSIDEVAACEQFGERGFFVPHARARGTGIPGLPFRAHKCANPDDGVAPWRGRDSSTVLREVLGMTDAEIAAQFDCGALADDFQESR